MTQVQYTVEPQGRPLAVMVSIATLEQAIDAIESLTSLVRDEYTQAEEDTLAALRAALANAEPTGWQPIKTAPKDGSFYLAFGEGKTWTQNQPNGCYPGEWYFSESRGEWRGYSLTDESTHWMPLPTQPKDAP